MTTTPDTAEAARTAQLAVELDMIYPGRRWSLKVGDQGDFTGPHATPAEAVESARQTFAGFDDMLSAGDVTIGLWTEELLFLHLQHRMVGAGLPLDVAQQLITDYAEALSDAHETANSERLWLGFTDVYTVSADGVPEVLA
ncbi:hypothetical protein [Deinococcus soli (ex Cha et al. 2016)]|uniref:Uncharacterized protein n=1 Tax=Deinococcus soli (ex Cha et al. 2016) TaxID=1309411 RepID=A0ACC6KM25_9DEIO|nr:hypothetical protein [Deinococcus soli (ex Cha et al. 2016)]MDR6753458.1 hypothetical protein [Deinococcus soli (ex Cha et al. 2016)]